MLLRLTISAEKSPRHRFRRHREDLRFRDVVFQTFVRDEEERAITADHFGITGPLNTAEPVIRADRPCLVAAIAEEVIRRAAAVAIEVPGSVQVVATLTATFTVAPAE